MRYVQSAAYQAVESSMVPALADILRSTLTPCTEYFTHFDEFAALCPNDRVAALVLTECGFAPMSNPAVWTQTIPGVPELDELDPGAEDSDDPTTLGARLRWMAATLDPCGLIRR